ncbi:MAG TPA: alkaline phosphatase family protein [Candidatus Binatia bacterium]|nr:alkaline phosphatase family protein [Candidatus Binatia bacterium]
MRFNPHAGRALPLAAAAYLLSACNGGGAGVSPGLPVANALSSHVAPLGQPIGRGPSKGKIKHIVIIVQENRSFNDLFKGYKGATTASYGYDSNGNKIKLLPIPLETNWDLEHDSWGDIAACNGTGSIPGTNCKNNGFNRESVGCNSSCPIPHPQYAYVPRAETKPYFAMANEWVLADNMFASNFDASSFISHQYIISGQAESAVNYPGSSWGCPGGKYDQIYTLGQQRQILYSKPEVVCWDPNTLGDELDKANVSWAFYGQFYSGSPWLWIAYQAINHIYNGPDWSKDIFGPPSTILNDVANGKLRSVSWVTPTWTNSDHAGSGSNTGPSWVTSVVNAIGESQYWDSTAIFVFWDDYGGWYDPVPQPYADYDGLGMRLPMLVISPYALHGRVSHVQYEHGSILKFVEDTFGLGRLTASDTRANSPARAFDFRQAPRPFVPIQAPYNRAFFLHQPPDNHVVDAE